MEEVAEKKRCSFAIIFHGLVKYWDGKGFTDSLRLAMKWNTPQEAAEVAQKLAFEFKGNCFSTFEVGTNVAEEEFLVE